MSAASVGPPAAAIAAARSSDLSQIRWLLNLRNLPSEDITPELLASFLVCRDAIGVVGVIGLEYYGTVALLRSLVVADGFEGRGLGGRLMGAATHFARRRGVRWIFLLTTTAEAFFERFGFRRIPRDCAPRCIEDSSEFKSLCPSTAALMVNP
jgi:amino-acid N-acetyltransferase